MNDLRATKLLAGVLFFLAAGGRLFAATPPAEPPPEHLTVYVHDFSGRPDPSWRISDSNAIAAIRERIKGYNAFSVPAPEWDKPYRLGFRGYELINHGVPGLPANIRVMEGTLRVGQGSQAKYYKDRNDVEGWLFRDALQHSLDKSAAKIIRDYYAKNRASSTPLAGPSTRPPTTPPASPCATPTRPKELVPNPEPARPRGGGCAVAPDTGTGGAASPGALAYCLGGLGVLLAATLGVVLLRRRRKVT